MLCEECQRVLDPEAQHRWFIVSGEGCVVSRVGLACECDQCREVAICETCCARLMPDLYASYMHERDHCPECQAADRERVRAEGLARAGLDDRPVRNTRRRRRAHHRGKGK